MGVPAILQGSPHLPLQVGMTAGDAIELANLFYQTSLNPALYSETQAFLNKNRLLSLELIRVDTGEVEVTFVNQTKAPVVVESTPDPDADEWVLDNPMVRPVSYTPWLGDGPLNLHSADEIAFLDNLGTGNSAPVISTDNELSYRLSRLLNSYQFLGQWTAGTLGEQTTGGFKLVFKGHSLDVPDGFLLDFSPMVAIVEILYGKQKGFICLRT